jgi:uncharacterized protein with FMN-binding domain
LRRAVIATAGTVVGLVFLLGYRSAGPVKLQRVATATGSGAAATTTTAPASVGTTTGPSRHTYTGEEVSYIYGSIEVAITLKGGRIVNVSVPENAAIDPRSQTINSEAVPILESEALAAQDMNFDIVSGASFTSDAFAQSFQSALNEAVK